MRVYFYTHLALVLGIAVPMCFEFSQLPFLIQSIASVAVSSLAISWVFPIVLMVVSLRRKDRWGLVVVPIDAILVWIHWMAVEPLVS
jgi:hypothetical protein